VSWKENTKPGEKRLRYPLNKNLRGKRYRWGKERGGLLEPNDAKRKKELLIKKGWNKMHHPG